LVIPDSIADFLPGRDDNNIACEYKTHGYTVLNRRLDYIASVLASLLNSKGYRTLPIPAAQRSDIDNAIPPVSHKMIAHIAGLGWIGKNCLLITEKHGPRVRFSSLLTNAPLKTKNSPMEQKCGTCMKCVKACPAEAIKGRNYIAGESREKRLDFKKCWEYFDMLKKTKDFDVCGMCLYVCPYGKNDKN
jgi:epoxyqueuosine reductase